MNQIEIFSIPTNTPPYTVFVCDYFGNNCIFTAQIITNVPPSYTINVPSQFDLTPAITLKIIDGAGCEINKQFICGQSSADKICKCDNVFNQNIYVFYDASTLSAATASAASQSVRTWFTAATETSGFTGNLYEAMIGKNLDNGENWMWWSTYPYLGSLTGGTLSDGFTQVNAFGVDVNDYVAGTEKKSAFCQATPTFACRPKLNSFNDDSGETIYQQINRGEDFSTGLSLSGSNIMGVPFDHNDLNGSDTGLYGNFSGQDKNYTVICVIDEADGIVGMYTSVKNLTADTLNEGIFQLIQSASIADAFTGSSVTAPYQPSTRFTSEYESFIKVWDDVKSQNGSFNGLVYPVIGTNVNSGFNFIHHVLAATEGVPRSASYFSNKYDRNGQTWPYINPDLNAINPVAYTFEGLETINYYTGLTATTSYTTLPSVFKNGPGLTNFGWFTDPTVSAFTQSIVAETLDNFVVRVSAGTDCKYIITDTNLTLNKIYYFDTELTNGIKGCYQVTEKNVVYSTNFVSPALFGNYDYCFECTGSYTPGKLISYRNSADVVFGYNNGNVSRINEMWTSSTFFSVLASQGVQVIRYPGGTNTTYWDWENSDYATTTEYPNLPYRFYSLNPHPSMDLDVRATALTANNLTNVWTLNDYFRSIQNQMDYLLSAQTLGLDIDYIEIGNEYYLNPGTFLDPDVNGFISRFPLSTTPPYSQYGVEKVDWVYSAKTNFPLSKVALCGSLKNYGVYPNSRRNTWNTRLIQALQDLTYNPTSIYPEAITFHSYITVLSTDFANINTWIQSSVESEYGVISATIDDFKTEWNFVSNIEFWVTEYNVDDDYNQISGSWAHGLYLISITFKMLGNNDITMVINNSLSAGRDFGMLFDTTNVFGAANTSDKFDLSAGGLVLGMFNRCLNDSTGFGILDLSSVSSGLYGQIFTGGTSNYLLYSNVTENLFTLNLSDVLDGFTVNYYLIYDALPTLYVNKKNPSTLVKEFPNITSGYTISNISSVDSPAFSVSYIEFT